MATLRKLMGWHRRRGRGRAGRRRVRRVPRRAAAGEQRRRSARRATAWADRSSMRTAAAVPDRIGAGASFHGGGLVTDEPDSPHLLVPKMKAPHLRRRRVQRRRAAARREGQAARRRSRRRRCRRRSRSTRRLHGWCVPDMPAEAGKPIYNKPDAERAWAKLVGAVQDRARLNRRGATTSRSSGCEGASCALAFVPGDSRALEISLAPGPHGAENARRSLASPNKQAQTVYSGASSARSTCDVRVVLPPAPP